MKKIVAFVAVMLVAVGSRGADSHIRGYQFDGRTNLMTGAMLEDLVTQSTFTEAAGLTNNAQRILDGVTIVTTNAGIGTTNWVAAVGTNSLTGGHIIDGSLTGADIESGSVPASDIEPGGIVGVAWPYTTPRWLTNEIVCFITTNTINYTPGTWFMHSLGTTNGVPSWAQTVGGEVRLAASDADERYRLVFEIRSTNGANRLRQTEVYCGGSITNSTLVRGDWPISSSNTFEWRTVAVDADGTETELSRTVDIINYHVVVDWYEGYK